MRICFVNDYFLKDPSVAVTGPMVQTYLLATGLAGRGWTVDFVAGTPGPRAGQTEVHEGVTVRYVRAGRFFELGTARAVARELDGIRADVFYQRGRSLLTGITARAARRCGARFVWASAGESGVRRRKYVGERLPKKRGLRKLVLWPVYAWADRLYERGIESADVLLVQTESQRQELKREFGRDSIIMKSGHPVPPESVLQKPQPPVVLWIGAVKPAKQPQLFLELARQCAGSGARFVMVGKADDAEWQRRLREAERAIPGFSYRGEVPFDAVTAVFAEASVLVNTTIPEYEGLPNSFIQAWLHGVPVVSLHADPDGMLEKEGLGFRCDGTEALVARVRELLSDAEGRRSMGRKARQFAEREYGLERIITEFERILNRA